MRIPRILAVVLAGGKGSRLGALTANRVKPALPIAGTYRLIDVALSNLAHSHISDVWLVQQYIPHTLNSYLANGRPWDLDRSHGGLQVLPPFEGAQGEGFAHGNSDSLYRQKELIRRFKPDLVLVLSADHLYTVNFLDVLDTHQSHNADLTMVTTEVSENPSRFAVVEVGHSSRVTGFEYKPEKPRSQLVAGEMFLYDAKLLLKALEALHEQHGELKDYGDDLVPWFVKHHTVVAHPLDGYWMDLGTLQSYWTAHMQLLDDSGAVLDDPDWPILSAQPQLLPSRVSINADIRGSMISAGAHVRGLVKHSVLGPRVVVERGATVHNSVLLDGVHVRSGAVLENVIANIGATIPSGKYGAAESVTLIDANGEIDTTQDFDRTAALPSGF